MKRHIHIHLSKDSDWSEEQFLSFLRSSKNGSVAVTSANQSNVSSLERKGIIRVEEAKEHGDKLLGHKLVKIRKMIYLIS